MEGQVKTIHRIIELCRDNVVETGEDWAKPVLVYQMESLKDLAYQEPPIAFEILCDNLIECCASIPREAYALIEELGQFYTNGRSSHHMEIKEGLWIPLAKRITPEKTA